MEQIEEIGWFSSHQAMFGTEAFERVMTCPQDENSPPDIARLERNWRNEETLFMFVQR